MVSFPAHHIQYNLILVLLFLSCNVCTYTHSIFIYSGMQKNYYSVHVLFSYIQVGLPYSILERGHSMSNQCSSW
jgi:hypothetical protein